MPVNSVVRVVELPKRCRIRPRRPRCGRRRLSRAELAPHLMPGNQPSHGLRARHQLYLPRQLGAGAAVSPHKRASHAAQAAAAAPPPHPRGRRDGWSCHNSLVAAPTLFTAAPGRFYGPPASHPGGPSRGLLSPQTTRVFYSKLLLQRSAMYTRCIDSNLGGSRLSLLTIIILSHFY